MNQRVLAFAMLVLATAILVHQYLVWGKIFEITDVYSIHHETLFLMLVAFAVGLEYKNIKKKSGEML